MEFGPERDFVPRKTIKIPKECEENLLWQLLHNVRSDKEFEEIIDQVVNIYQIEIPPGYVEECNEALVARTQQEMDENPLSATTIAYAAGLSVRTDENGKVTCYVKS